MRVAALYAQQYDIFLRDRYLFHQPQEDPLRSKLGSKRRFLEKAKFLFEESAKMARKGQQYIHKFFLRKKNSTPSAPPQPMVLGRPTKQPQAQTCIHTFFSGHRTKRLNDPTPCIISTLAFSTTLYYSTHQ